MSLDKLWSQLFCNAFLLALSTVCCGGEGLMKADLDPPSIVAIESDSDSLAPEGSWVIRFSEPVQRDRLFFSDAEGVEWLDGVGLGAATDADAMRNAIDRPPLTQSERDRLTIPLAAEFSADRTELRVVASTALEVDTEYVLVISARLADDMGNLLSETVPTALSRMYRFRTSGRAGASVYLLQPGPQSMGVSFDVTEVVVRFSVPMDRSTVSADLFSLVDVESGERFVPSSLLWSDNAEVATLTLPSHGADSCETLCPDRRYSLFVADGARRADGGALIPPDPEEQSFATASCLDSQAPSIDAYSVQVIDIGDDTAFVEWRTDEPSSSQVQFLRCGEGDACPSDQRGQDASCAVDRCDVSGDLAMWTCLHRVAIVGLNPSTDYSVRVVSRDAGGREAFAAAPPLRTLPPQPHLVITELFASPQGLVGADGRIDPDIGKFVELRNVGSVPVDLTPVGLGTDRQGWALGKCATPDCLALCASCRPWLVRPSGAIAVLEPGAYAVAGGRDFDPVRMGVPPQALLLAGDGRSSTLLSNGLASGMAHGYVLIDPSGRFVSRYQGELGEPSRNPGRSFERWPPDARAGAWRLSTSLIPGLVNNQASPGSPGLSLIE